MRIVVVIRGGCLSTVLCDDPQAEVELIDFDNAEEVDPNNENEDMDTAAADKYLEELSSSMAEVF